MKNKLYKSNYRLVEKLNRNDEKSIEIMERAVKERNIELISYSIVSVIPMIFLIRAYFLNVNSITANPSMYVVNFIDTGWLNRMLLGSALMSIILFIATAMLFETIKETPTDYMSDVEVAYINKVSYEISSQIDVPNVFVGAKGSPHYRPINKVKYSERGK